MNEHLMAGSRANFIVWVVGDAAYECQIHPSPCPVCGARRAIVAMPEPLIKQQPDDTTAVCHPSLGGCNQGYAAMVGGG